MQKQSFNQGWRFHLETPQENRQTRPDEANWRRLDLPHDYSIEQERRAENPSTASNGFFGMGRAHYHKTFFAPEVWQGKTILVLFEGVYMNAEISLNEHYLGRHPYGYTSFTLDLTPYLKIGAENVLRVVVDNSTQMNSRWYSGSGIYRPVWLVEAEPVHIVPWGVYVTTPEVSPSAAAVHVEVTVENRGAAEQPLGLELQIYGPDNHLAASLETSGSVAAGATQVFQYRLPVENPRLWSPDAPNLYRLESIVTLNGKESDCESTTFGIRTLEFSVERGFLLNGVPTLLKGGCVHHDNGILGAISYQRAEERKVEIHKASGYNAIRTAHNPPAPAFLDACDRQGMLVIDESFDCWRTGKNPYDYHLAFDDWWQRDMASMLLRDRNHPSIILWSIGNEVLERDGRSGGAQIARQLAEIVRQYDRTRPVTSAICGVWDQERRWADTDAVFAQLDVGGYNYLWQSYAPDHERHPQRIMVGTESFPLEALDNWRSVEELPYVIGDFVWTSLDYLGEAGIGRVHFDPAESDFLGKYPWHQANCGDLDLCGFKRPQSYYRDMVWKTGSPLYIAVHAPIPEGKTPIVSRWGWPDVLASWNWAGHEGKNLKVDVYSTYERVELLLNGRSLGEKTAERLTASFEAPYVSGELKAIGRTSGQPDVEFTLRTAAVPAAIKLCPDRAQIQSGEGDLCYVSVQIVDGEGLPHPAADRPIYFTIDGPGSIAAVGSADPLSKEPYRGNVRSTYRGCALVVVKSGLEPGEIRLRAQADGLQPAEIILQTSGPSA